MTYRRFLPVSLVSVTALLSAASASHAQQPVALPGLNVQGATLAKPSAQPQAAATPDAPAAPAPTADAGDGVSYEKIGTSVSVVTAPISNASRSATPRRAAQPAGRFG